MESDQAFQIELAQRRLRMSDGELMQLAREIAQNGNLKSLAELGCVESWELIHVMEVYERGEVGRKMREREFVAG